MWPDGQPRHPATSALPGLDHEGGDWPRHFAIVDGLMLVANQKSDSVTMLAIDPDTGVPRPTGETIEVPSPTCVLPA